MKIIEKIKEKFNEIFRKTKKGLALTGTVAALGVTAVGCGKEDEKAVDNNASKIEQESSTTGEYSSKRDAFAQEIHVDINGQIQSEAEIQNEEENETCKKIIEEYNAKYPDSQISENDLGIIRSTPEGEYFIEQTNEDGTITYIQRCTGSENLKENQSEIASSSIKSRAVYTVINRQDKTVITSIGKVGEEIVDVITEGVKVGNTEYLAGDKSITLEAESEAEKAEQYIDLVHKYEEILEEREAEEAEK